MSNLIHYQANPEYQNDFSKTLVYSIAEKTLDYLGLSPCEIGVVLETNIKTQELNNNYRHVDSPTDVLTFSYNHVDPETNRLYLGDIVLSGEKIIEQARELDQNPQRELCLLIVHGILHLAGYDHEKEQDEAVMLPLQENIIQMIQTK